VALIKRHEEVVSAAVFTGGTAPRFYYNVEPKEPANYLAQILINTRHADDVEPLLVKLRQELDQSVPGLRCVVKQLEQGPPVKEPIQIRLPRSAAPIGRPDRSRIARGGWLPCVR
jgi:hypothetical protein